MTASTQTEISFTAPKASGPAQAAPFMDERVEVLVKLLDGCEWMTAATIIQRHFLATGTRWQDRLIRDLAAESGGRVAGGQNGYKLSLALEPEEKEHTVNWLRSQAEKMKHRATQIEAIWLNGHRQNQN